LRNLILIILILFVIICSFPLYADSGPFAINWQGNIVPLNEGHKSIRMESELVEIFLYGEYYQVVASFDFYNYGDSTTIIMGFPERQVINYPNDSIIYKYGNGFIFRTSFVDGKEVEVNYYEPSYRNHYLSNTYLTYLYNSVKFEKNQKRKIIFTYTQEYTEKDDLKEIEFNFTGGNWYRDVAHCKLVIYPRTEFENVEPLPNDTRYENGKYIFEKFNWEPEYRFLLKGYVTKNTYNVLFLNNFLVEVYQVFFESGIFANFYYYMIKDYFRNTKFITPYILSRSGELFFDKHENLSIGDISYFNIMKDENHIMNTISVHYYDFKKSYNPLFVFNNIKYVPFYKYVFSHHISDSKFYFVLDFKDSLRTIIMSDSLNKSETLDSKEAYSILTNSAATLDSQIQNNYSIFNKSFFPGEYKNNIEAYVLQLIFLGRDIEAWEYFEDNFPIFCSKESSREFILKTKQDIIDLTIK